MVRQLLVYALTTNVALSRQIGSYDITHPLDDTLRAFCRRFGFTDLPGDPRRAMIVRTVDLIRSGFTV